MLSRHAFINVAGDDMHKTQKTISIYSGYGIFAFERRISDSFMR